MNEKRHRMIGRFGRWSVAIFLLATSLAVLGMGVTPRYIEELRIGGGYGDSADGGADFEQDGDILTDGDLTVTGNTSVGNRFDQDLLRSWSDYGLLGSASSEALFRLDLTGTPSSWSGTIYGCVFYNNYTGSIAEGGVLFFEITYTYKDASTKDIQFSYYDLGHNGTSALKIREYATDQFEAQYIGPGWFVRYQPLIYWRNTQDPDFSVFGDSPTSAGSLVTPNGTLTLVNDCAVGHDLILDSDSGMLKFGDSQDFQLRYEQVSSDHYFKVEDGSGNDMLTVLDKGTVGEVGVTGTLDMDGRIEYVNSGVITLDGNNPTPVDFTDEGGIDMPDATYAVLISAETTGSPITVTWANRSTTGFEISAWNVSTGSASTSSTLRVSWMVVDQ